MDETMVRRWEEEGEVPGGTGQPGGTIPPPHDPYERDQGVEYPQEGTQRGPSSTETHLDGLLAGRSRLRPVVRPAVGPVALDASQRVVPSRGMLRDASARSLPHPDASQYSGDNTHVMYSRQMLRPVPSGPEGAQKLNKEQRRDVPGQHTLRALPADASRRPHDVAAPGSYERPPLRATPGARASTASATRLGDAFPPDTVLNHGGQQYGHVARGAAHGGPRASTAGPSLASLSGSQGATTRDVQEPSSTGVVGAIDGYEEGSNLWGESTSQREAHESGDARLSRVAYDGGRASHVSKVQGHDPSDVAVPHGWDRSGASEESCDLINDHVAATRGDYCSDATELDAVQSGHVAVPHGVGYPTSQPRASIMSARASMGTASLSSPLPAFGPTVPPYNVGENTTYMTQTPAGPIGRPSVLASSPFAVDGSPASNPANPAFCYPGGPVHPVHSMGPWNIGAMHAPVSLAGTHWGPTDASWVDVANAWQSGASSPMLATGPGGALYMMVPSGMVQQKGPGSGHVAGLHQPHPDSPAGRLRSELMSKIGSQAASLPAGE